MVVHDMCELPAGGLELMQQNIVLLNACIVTIYLHTFPSRPCFILESLTY